MVVPLVLYADSMEGTRGSMLADSRSDPRSHKKTPLMGVESGVWYWSLHRGVF